MLVKQIVFRKQYTKILGGIKSTENDQKVNILVFWGVSGGFREVNPPQPFPFFKIYIFCNSQYLYKYFDTKILKIEQKLSSYDFLKNIPHKNDKKSLHWAW